MIVALLVIALIAAGMSLAAIIGGVYLKNMPMIAYGLVMGLLGFICGALICFS